jgi:predicted dehydrogenase
VNANNTLRVGIIGCGNIVEAGHRPALAALDDVEVVALMDVTVERLKLGQRCLDSVMKICTPNLDR